MTRLPSPRSNLPRDSTLRRFGLDIALVALIAFPNLAWPQAPPSAAVSNDYLISVKVNEVVLHATAQDGKGVLVSGLGKEQFQIYEDGVLQTVKHFGHEDVPVTVGLVIDNSGSMGRKRADVIAAALAFAHSSNPHDQIFVVNFNEKVSFALPDDVPFTDDVVQLQAALSRIISTGETALYDAVAAALEHLEKGAHDKKVLIVISDGGDNASKHTLAQIRSLAGQPGAIIYTVGIFDEQDGDQNPHVLKQLAKDTGGEVFLPESSKEVASICEQIARDIRNQYTITYIPANRKADGSYRLIQVKANEPRHKRLLIRTRTGYYAPGPVPLSPRAKAEGHGGH